MSDYHPTLWRTCRVLANVQRLTCLKTVLETPYLSVGDVAKQLRIPLNKASLCLRALQARGLLQAHRHSRWVRYCACPDPLIPEAAPLLSALQKALQNKRTTERDLLFHLTGFTHPRRLALLIFLQRNRCASFEALVYGVQISPPALWRHLGKLRKRGLIQETPDGWRLERTLDAFSHDLLRILSFVSNLST